MRNLAEFMKKTASPKLVRWPALFLLPASHSTVLIGAFLFSARSCRWLVELKSCRILFIFCLLCSKRIGSCSFFDVELTNRPHHVTQEPPLFFGVRQTLFFHQRRKLHTHTLSRFSLLQRKSNRHRAICRFASIEHLHSPFVRTTAISKRKISTRLSFSFLSRLSFSFLSTQRKLNHRKFYIPVFQY